MKNKYSKTRNTLFPKVGTRWVCIKEYPTSSIFNPSRTDISAIEPGNEVVFLAVKRFEISDILNNETMPFWVNWLSFCGFPVTIVWWESLPMPDGSLLTIPNWNEHFVKKENDSEVFEDGRTNGPGTQV